MFQYLFSTFLPKLLSKDLQKVSVSLEAEKKHFSAVSQYTSLTEQVKNESEKRSPSELHTILDFL